MSNLPHFTQHLGYSCSSSTQEMRDNCYKKDKYESVATPMVTGYDQVFIRYLFVPFFQDRVRPRVDQKLF